jgi:alpha-L-fucosidase
MNQRNIVVALLAAAAAGVVVLCNIQTESGPTPYNAFNGRTFSVSPVDVGKGQKTFSVPASLPLVVSSDRTVTITTAANDTISMVGFITSYNVETGGLTVNVIHANGQGSFNSWDIVLAKTFDEIQDSLRQVYSDMKFGMFVHFNMSTFDRCCCPECYSVTGEWGLPNADENKFNPAALNCGQWADVAASAGCKYVVLTAKHHDGFCLWPSAHTTHDVASSSWRGGNGDVIREFVDSVRLRGLKPGLYYSIRDLTNGIDTNFIKGQLTELLSNYGDLVCLWFDGWGWDAGYRRVPYTMVLNLIKKIQPYCMLIENNHEYTTAHSEIIEYEMPIDGPPKIGNTQPTEGNEPIRVDAGHCWFWHPIDSCTIMSASYIISRLDLCNSRNASYLLDLTPDTTGRIPQCQADRMQEVGVLRGVTR